ncbi:phosphorylase family protein [Candidatus Atelocyanobacterium thalassae]|uniref:Nucleoside phosphorylase domain-containing protein n=1 Tax=cyanobacterium endosymbiont of Braarudosphaera bigelowii TaxID=1285375 RepID=A0ABM7U4V9_9CHRO|nr:purine phosphorylase [Candidatus Atelocyanobacterium thalassa]BDA39644.1 hypothetical protein CPARK_000048300 [cyanobacterium endosymbiont of Braarudosphaera bigelowii]
MYKENNFLDCWFDLLLVPQGAEYQAVLKGISKSSSKVKLKSVPAGVKAITKFLEEWEQNSYFLKELPQTVMMIGLGGSLSPKNSIGDIVVYKECTSLQSQLNEYKQCDIFLSQLVLKKLKDKCILGRGITNHYVISSAKEKQTLGKIYKADVIDMEGLALLNWGRKWNISVIIIRIISDSCQQDMPDLRNVFDIDGNLKYFHLAIQMIKKPLLSIDLICSSLKSLNVLRKSIKQLMFCL